MRRKLQFKKERRERAPEEHRMKTKSAVTMAAAVLITGVFAAAGVAQAWTLKTLYSFCAQANCTDGDTPLAGLVMDPAGNLYGTAQFGGAYDWGVIFELKRKNGGWNYKVLYS